jgi:MurNAc alpha-1-phosphate uridylyltransferase
MRTFSAMIMAAGRGTRMRPLSDHTPKPLLRAGGKALIEWQVEGLARAGFCDIVINVAIHADQIIAALGDGARFGATLRYSREPEPLENAGGIATALPLLAPGPVLTVAGDVWTTFDYAALRMRAMHMAQDATAPRAHLVLVPNPPYHPQGDFALTGGMVVESGAPRLTYASIGLHDTALFEHLPRHVPLAMLPLWQAWIAERRVSGEYYAGPWANVGTPGDLAALDAQLSAPAAHATR